MNLKRFQRRCCFFTIGCLLTCGKVHAQRWGADTSYIHAFPKKNVVEVFSGQYGTHFDFTSHDNRKNNYKLVANTSGYLGTYINYKWLSFKYSWSIPGTRLDENTGFHYTSLSFKITQGNMLFRPFYHSYNGLLIPERKERRRMIYTPFRDIHVSDAGTDLYYLTNAKKFSFNAANYFSERQVKSAGSFLFMATPMWERLSRNARPAQGAAVPQHVNSTAATSTRTPPASFLASNIQWFSLIGRVGYTYNFVLAKGRWSVAPAVLLGGGGLKELNTTDKYIRSIYDVQSWINAGYNGTNYYLYLNAKWNSRETNLLIRNMHQTDTDLSLTTGFRLGNLKRKILGVL